MSDTPDATAAADPQDAPAPEPAPDATPAPEAAQDAPQPEATPEPPAAAPDKNGDRRFARLTAKAAAAATRAEIAERELAEAKARLELLQASGAQPAAPAAQPDVEAEVNRRLAAARQQERHASLVQEGYKLFGKEAWEEKGAALGEMGAYANPAFLPALYETPNAAQVVALLADDPDRLTGLLAKGPIAMAAEMGRLSAEAGTPKAPPVSRAPAPVTPISAGRVAPTFDFAATDKSSIKEWIAERNKVAPEHLGGVRKRA